MNKGVRYFTKAMGMLALFIAALLISTVIGFLPGFSLTGETKLGKDIFLIDYIFTRKGVFRVISIKGDSIPDFAMPHYLTMDTVTGKMRQNVVSVQRDDRYVAFKTKDMQTEEKSFYILDKSFSDKSISAGMTEDRLRERFMFATSDSIEFARRCDSLGIPILLK